MRDYLNSEERTKHIILMCCQTTAENFSQSEALTEEEQKCLKKITEYAKKLNQSLFKRLGKPYERKITQTMQANKLRLVGNYEPVRDAISISATEDLIEQLGLLQSINCMGCEKKDFTACGIYGMCLSCDIKENNTDGGCPYKMWSI